MKLKFYLRGLGIGIVVTALIMGIATRDKVPLTDAEIKAAAARLGMVESDSLKLSDLDQGGVNSKEPGEPEGAGAPENGTNPSEPEGTGAPDNGTNPAEPEGTGALDTGTNSAEPEGTGAPNTGTNSAEPEGTGAPNNGTNPSEPEGTGASNNGTNPSEPEGTGAPDTGTNSAASEPGATQGSGFPVSVNPDSGSAETITVTIKRGTGSRAVSTLLAEAGLVADAAAFDQYLIDSGYSKRISSGTFEIPAGSSEEEVAKIISRSK